MKIPLFPQHQFQNRLLHFFCHILEEKGFINLNDPIDSIPKTLASAKKSLRRIIAQPGSNF